MKKARPSKGTKKTAKSALSKGRAVKTRKPVKKSKSSKPARPGGRKTKPVKAVKKAIKKHSGGKSKIVKKVTKFIKKTIKKVMKPATVVKTIKPVKPVNAKLEKKIEKPNTPIISKTTPVNIPMKETPKQKAPEKIVAKTPERSRYADEELKEFKGIILKKLEEARKELVNLQAALVNANEHGTDDTASTFKMLEDGSDTLAKEEAGQLAARQRKFIEQLENALVRIENKTYGVCRVTGKLIPKERLRAVPHTTQSIEAKLQQYKD